MPTKLEELAVGSESHPWISGNGLELLFSAVPPDAGLATLWRTQRDASNAPFASPAPLQVDEPADASVSTPFVDVDRNLWFSVQRQGATGDIYRAPAVSATAFGTANAVNGIAEPTVTELLPVLSADGLLLYFGRSTDATEMHYDIWTAQRQGRNVEFGAPSQVPELSLDGGATSLPGWLSRDRCQLYFSSNASGRLSLYRASRQPSP